MKNLNIIALALAAVLLAGCREQAPPSENKNFSEEQHPTDSSGREGRSQGHSGQNIGSHTDSTSADGPEPNMSDH